MTFNQRRSAVFAGLATLALVVAPLQAGAAWGEDAPVDELTPDPVVMGEYNPADYVDEAAELPTDLVDALQRDLGITAEEYLAEADAAVQASDVVESLENSGIAVLGSSIDGTDLTVYVDTDAAASAVESAGATAVFGPPAVEEKPDVPLEFAEDIYGGQPYVWQTSGSASYNLCTTGFNGFTSSGTPQLVTAGHCTEGMAGISGSVNYLRTTKPSDSGASLGPAIGSPVSGTTEFGGGFDVGRVSVSSANTAKASVLTWGSTGTSTGSGAPLSSTPLTVTRSATATVGAKLCHSGATTGWRCGTVTGIETADVGGYLVNSIVATICVLPGDSGGSAMIGTAAVGITSWRAVGPQNCNEPADGGFFPMQGSGATVASAYGSAWELQVYVATPKVSFTGTGVLSSVLSGTLAGGGSSHTVKVYIDGSSTPLTATVSAGKWQVSLAGLTPGFHSFRAQAQFGSWSKSASLTGSFTSGIKVTRIAGDDRFAVGVALSQDNFPTSGVPVVYISNGLNFPDALSAAPAAALQGGPLLLTKPTELPATVKAEIKRLKPQKIVVVGGVNSVSTAVYNTLKALTPSIKRLGGADRYEASRAIVRDAFDRSSVTVTTAYIATGANFPDALSASGAGGEFGIPVILVNGTAKKADAATIKLLKDLGVTQIKVAGGPNSVSTDVLNSLRVIDSTPTRLSGTDRFEASKNIAVDAFGAAKPDTVFLATGFNFPDALSGAAVAGLYDAPLIVVQTDCIPASTLQAIKDFGTTKITLLGGTASLTKNVANLKSC